jgi:hypothetical protein
MEQSGSGSSGAVSDDEDEGMDEGLGEMNNVSGSEEGLVSRGYEPDRASGERGESELEDNELEDGIFTTTSLVASDEEGKGERQAGSLGCSPINARYGEDERLLDQGWSSSSPSDSESGQRAAEPGHVA